MGIQFLFLEWKARVGHLTTEVKILRKRLNPSKEELLLQLRPYLTREAFIIVSSQLHNFERTKEGYRWSTELKNVALSLRATSNKAYLKLRKIFKLPSVRTIQQLLDTIQVNEGFHQSILEALKIRALKTTDQNDLELSMTFDEMNLSTVLEYDERADAIVGLDRDKDTPIPVINSVGVFMVRGIKADLKQSIGYFYSSGSMSADRIQKLTREAILAVNKTGYKVKAFISDQGPNNVKAMKILNDNSSVLVNEDGSKTYMFYDTPHLIKNTRNNFKANGFVNGKGEKITWSVIERLLEYNISSEVNYCPKLKEKHVDLAAFKEMDVKKAAQVCSLQYVQCTIARLVTHMPGRQCDHRANSGYC